MSRFIEKSVQYSADKTISESAEYIIKNLGLTPASVFSMVMAEIARTGRIPVSNQISDDDFNTAQLIALSHNIPSVKVSNIKSAQAFLDDDGGY
ncbi:type II toxin-antitoxin system RelB/DinJ family antitoxin [Acinetobacter sp. SCC474]|uniref:type II toxin-antitoxin system RelB/DinJ family antitoxin n=1 Tax=Acinetobacter pollinis TaxID=2605270 RepID=UPI0018A29D12|nr:type II toxin-antitoxin system RelB/DinJ family antitoxin [Acinetobacter pollinis]MBF7691583.1 type II toxin-antitoxin system RelB/DinJ family antitoxin [Acinetobacter pollinis]